MNENSTQAEVAQTSIGQGETLVTPAHMAMLAAAIANKGVLMKPYMIDKVENSNGTIVSQAEKTECKKLMTKSQAKQLQEYMSAVCDYGTARIFQVLLTKYMVRQVQQSLIRITTSTLGLWAMQRRAKSSLPLQLFTKI